MAIKRLKPALFKKINESTKDNRISICTNCRAGIFIDHQYQWSSKGLVHIDCENKVGANAIKNVS